MPSGENQTLSKKVDLSPDIEASAVTLAMAGSLSICGRMVVATPELLTW